MYTWYWHPYIDPSFNLSVVTRAEWYNNSDTGFDDPLYDSWWKKQSSLVNFEQRRALVWKMEAYLAKKRPYIQLVVIERDQAHSTAWTGFEPTLGGSCKCYFTSPRSAVLIRAGLALPRGRCLAAVPAPLPYDELGR